MPSTPVHFPAQLAKRCGAVAGSVASAPSTGTVSTGTSVVVVSVGAGAGASAFSQPASNTSAAALAMITLFCIMRLLPIPNASASISFLLGDDLRELHRIDIAARQRDERRVGHRHLPRQHRGERRRAARFDRSEEHTSELQSLMRI